MQSRSLISQKWYSHSPNIFLRFSIVFWRLDRFFCFQEKLWSCNLVLRKGHQQAIHGVIYSFLPIVRAWPPLMPVYWTSVLLSYKSKFHIILRVQLYMWAHRVGLLRKSLPVSKRSYIYLVVLTTATGARIIVFVSLRRLNLGRLGWVTRTRRNRIFRIIIKARWLAGGLEVGKGWGFVP